MTIVQMQYILAVARWGSFTMAAEKCFVTQPTLSMQIQKLEEQLDVQIFDRNKKPVAVTPIGSKIVEQASIVIGEAMRIKDIIDSEKNSVSGDFRLGIIPTVMPTLLPLFLRTYMKKYPKVTLHVEEIQTPNMLEALKDGMIDAGIAATPLQEPDIIEHPLYLEPMVAFVDENSDLYRKKKVTPEDISRQQLLLLENGHCFRNSVLNLCQDAKKTTAEQKFRLSSGNFETLVGLSKDGFGTTVLPYLNTLSLRSEDTRFIREFTAPVPSREISLIHSSSQLRMQVSMSLVSVITGIIRGMIMLDDTKVISPIESRTKAVVA